MISSSSFIFSMAMITGAASLLVTLVLDIDAGYQKNPSKALRYFLMFAAMSIFGLFLASIGMVYGQDTIKMNTVECPNIRKHVW